MNLFSFIYKVLRNLLSIKKRNLSGKGQSGELKSCANVR